MEDIARIFFFRLPVRVSFGPGLFTYQAFACYDLLDNGKQKLDEYGTWTGDTLVLKPFLLHALFTN